MTKFLSLYSCRQFVSHICGGHPLRRCLTTGETATALRPFMFKVHPDLFGRHPKEQAVNEHSLKLLNQYIEQLLGHRQVQPLTLIFYVRDVSGNQSQANSTGFRSVQLRLVSSNVCDAIKFILTSCNLPLDYVKSVESVKPATKPSGDNLSRFVDEVDINIFGGFYAQPRGPSRQRLARDTLNSWLVKNVTKARERCQVMKPVKQDIAQLKASIIASTGVVDIRWECGWALSSFRTALNRLVKIFKQISPSINLSGKTIIFGNGLGVCIRGFIILRYDDVPENWMMVLESIPQQNATLNKIPPIESYISSLLSNAMIGRHAGALPPFLLVDDYQLQLLKLGNALRDLRVNEPEAARISTDLTDVELIVECAAGPLMVSQSGRILIPSACPAFLIVKFINENAAEARRVRRQHVKTESEHSVIVEECRKELGVESLVNDSNITRHQMELCCTRLHKLSSMAALAVDLTLCNVKVAQFYSVMADGDMCIPWNFEDVV